MNIPAEFGICDSDLTEMVIPNDLRAAKNSEDRILLHLARFDYSPESTFAIKLAMEEALTNAIKHGNRNDRRKQLVLRYFIDNERAVIMVRDQGAGFAPADVPDPTAEENLERPNGRGLMLMHAYMSRVRFNAAGNEVWMLKFNRDEPIERRGF